MGESNDQLLVLPYSLTAEVNVHIPRLQSWPSRIWIGQHHVGGRCQRRQFGRCTASMRLRRKCRGFPRHSS